MLSLTAEMIHIGTLPCLFHFAFRHNELKVFVKCVEHSGLKSPSFRKEEGDASLTLLVSLYAYGFIAGKNFTGHMHAQLVVLYIAWTW